MKTAYIHFDYLGELELPIDCLEECYHQGQCDADVERWLEELRGSEYLSIDADTLKKELSQYGAWDDQELSNHDDNLRRLIWIAAGNYRTCA